MNKDQVFTKIIRWGVVQLVFLCWLFGHDVHGATYYISPTGSDSNSGTSPSTPWKTFSFAIPQLYPGDTLVLLNGTYNASNSGFLHVLCDTTARNGTAAQPIVVTAENERQAFIHGNGTSNPIYVRSCAHWRFYGIRAENSDVTASSGGEVIHAYQSNNLVFQRMLLARPNICQNAHVITFWLGAGNSRVEESELYSFHRHGIDSSNESGNIFRRNYINSRARADAACSPASDPSTRGDAGIVIYPGSNNIIENNISEGNGAGFDVPADGTTIGNKFYGNISLNDFYGIKLVARGSTLDKMPRDTTIEHHVAITPVYVGLYFRSSKNTQIKNSTALSSSGSGFIADRPTFAPGDNNPSVFSTDTLSLNNPNYGFYIENQTNWLLEYPNSYNNGVNYQPSSHANIVNPRSVDAALGNCRVWIPDNSPLHGLGSNGSYIGAKVLYRYENGSLTTTPLWDPVTGKFPCGTTIAGVNDISGSSCFDVHNRLNVNTNGCSFPAGYGGPPSAPTNFRVDPQ